MNQLSKEDATKKLNFYRFIFIFTLINFWACESNYDKSLKLIEKGETSEGIKLLKLVQPNDKDYSASKFLLGQFYSRKGAESLSYAAFKEVADDDSNYFSARFEIGKYLYTKMSSDTIGYNREYNDVLHNLEKIPETHKNYKEAKELIKSATNVRDSIKIVVTKTIELNEKWDSIALELIDDLKKLWNREISKKLWNIQFGIMAQLNPPEVPHLNCKKNLSFGEYLSDATYIFFEKDFNITIGKITPNGGAGWAYGKAILSIPLGVNNEPYFKLKINSFGNLFGVKESEIKTKLYSCNSFTLKEVLGMLKKDYIIERELSRINKAKQKILKELEKVIK